MAQGEEFIVICKHQWYYPTSVALQGGVPYPEKGTGSRVCMMCDHWQRRVPGGRWVKMDDRTPSRKPSKSRTVESRAIAKVVAYLRTNPLSESFANEEMELVVEAIQSKFLGGSR
jgi:hypothetical protein